MQKAFLAFVISLGLSAAALATVFGSVRGVVHDPQHRPVPSIKIILKAKTSDFLLTAETDANGDFQFDSVPLGQYSVIATDPAFAPEEQLVTVFSGTAPVLHLELHLATQNQSVTVSADAA